jgi:hypothetical protein
MLDCAWKEHGCCGKQNIDRHAVLLLQNISRAILMPTVARSGQTIYCRVQLFTLLQHIPCHKILFVLSQFMKHLASEFLRIAPRHENIRSLLSSQNIYIIIAWKYQNKGSIILFETIFIHSGPLDAIYCDRRFEVIPESTTQ